MIVLRLPVAVTDAVAVLELPFGQDPDAAQVAQAIHTTFELKRNAPGYAPFHADMINACRTLRDLARAAGSDTAVVISSSYRFDDASGDTDWMAVSIGDYRFNNGTYFGSAPGPEHPHHAQGKAGRALLAELVKRNWAARLGNLSRLKYLKPGAREIGLLIRPDGDFLMIGDSVEGQSGIFWAVEPGGFRLAGFQSVAAAVAAEIDELVDHGDPIAFVAVDAFAAELVANLESYRMSWAVDGTNIPRPWRESRVDTQRHLTEALRLLRAGDEDATLATLVYEAGFAESEAMMWILKVRAQLQRARELEAEIDDLARRGR